MRTREQIIADLEARYADLEAEAKTGVAKSCWSCRYCSTRGTDGYQWGPGIMRNIAYKEYFTCTEPLVRGFDLFGPKCVKNPMPCGPEKALWQPKPTLRERITEWLKGLFE